MTMEPKDTKTPSAGSHQRLGGFPRSKQETCAGTTQFGRPCKSAPLPGKNVCYSHSDDPEHVKQRRHNARAGSHAAHSPINREITELKDELKSLIREVKEGEVLPGPASVITQLSNVLLRAIETERKLRETEELEARLDALENGPQGRNAA